MIELTWNVGQGAADLQAARIIVRHLNTISPKPLSTSQRCRTLARVTVPEMLRPARRRA